MTLLLILLFLLLVCSFLISIASPYLAIYFYRQPTLGLIKRAKRLRVLSVLVALIIFFNAIGISLVNHKLNVASVIIALLCSGTLVIFSFTLRFKLLPGKVIGILSLFAWILLISFLLISSVTDNISPQISKIGDKMYCRVSSYGYVTSDSGKNIEVFERYLFFDKLTISERYSDMYDQQKTHLSSSEMNIIKQCL